MAQPAADLTKTVFFDKHQANNGRMVDFAGYALPVQYEGIIAEHNWTRGHAGLFDVSHMGPCFLSLNDPSGDTEADHAAIAAIMEKITCGNIAGLKPGQIRYTLLLNDEGGIIDDLMVARSADQAGTLYIVVNAGTKLNDFKLIEQAAGDQAKLTRADDGGLMALQGPEAAKVMTEFMPEAAELGFMNYAGYDWNGTRIMIARSGYTGEDGFEILVPAAKATDLWDALTADDRVKPVGLGARDSLRLEAGLPLYGHDLDETVSPIEAGLGFAVPKARRERADFPGAQRILNERENQPARVRVGLAIEGAPAREGAVIRNGQGDDIGIVTSGGFSPTLSRAIAIGFVPPDYAAENTGLNVVVRNRVQPARTAPIPFVQHRYYRKPKS